MSFGGFTYSNMGEDLLTGEEMTQRQLYASPKTTLAWMTTQKIWEPGVYCTLNYNRLESVISR